MTIPAYDIFQVLDSMLWIGSASTIEDAQSKLRQFAGPGHGRFLLLDQQSGNQMFFEIDGANGNVQFVGGQGNSDGR
ncbi:MAG TPA: hypothetical protein VK703_09290 [Candidatus Acidoferrales bacterium]|jgi:hypothetical protein|nr:hypothetical protein [Candidatus Acidoferrales bacterium]